MTDPVVPFDYGLRRAMRGERAAPERARERVRARLESSLGIALGAVSQTAVAPTAGATRAPGRVPWWWAGAFAAGCAASVVALGLLSSRAPRVVYVDRVVAAPTATPPPALATPELVASSAPLAAAEPGFVPAPSRPAHATGAPAVVGGRGRAPRASSFAAEAVLLDEARQALVAEAANRALARLDEHRARFPHGALAEEREAMRVEALVLAGRYAEARGRAAAFRARSPSSLFAATVDTALKSIPGESRE